MNVQDLDFDGLSVLFGSLLTGCASVMLAGSKFIKDKSTQTRAVTKQDHEHLVQVVTLLNAQLESTIKLLKANQDQLNRAQASLLKTQGDLGVSRSDLKRAYAKIDVLEERIHILQQMLEEKTKESDLRIQLLCKRSSEMESIVQELGS